jgi:hypothetical protein
MHLSKILRCPLETPTTPSRRVPHPEENKLKLYNNKLQKNMPTGFSRPSLRLTPDIPTIDKQNAKMLYKNGLQKHLLPPQPKANMLSQRI